MSDEESDFYASSEVLEFRSAQENLMIDMFAKKHRLTIEQVEVLIRDKAGRK